MILNNYFSIAGLVLVLIIVLGIVAFLKYKKDRCLKQDYKAMFIIGISWVSLGIVFYSTYQNISFLLMGLIFMSVGLANKDKWDEEIKPSVHEKRKIIIPLLTGTLILVLLTGVYVSIKKVRNESNHHESKDNNTLDNKDNSNNIGGERDVNSCLGPAGFSYDDEIGACVRMWEVRSESKQKAAKLATEYIKKKVESTGLTVVAVNNLGCEGCYEIKFNQTQSLYTIEIKDWVASNERTIGIDSFLTCEESGNPVMESYPRQCKSGDNTFTEIISGIPSDGDEAVTTNDTEISATKVSNFQDCILMGNPAMESYPRQCNHGNETFTEYIGNELEKIDLINLNSPRPNQEIASPLLISGQARGGWFFEGDAPVILTDWDGLIIAEGYITASRNAMTEEFVPFDGKLEFTKPNYKSNGTLILRKDNPSDNPSFDDALEIPVMFKGVGRK